MHRLHLSVCLLHTHIYYTKVSLLLTYYLFTYLLIYLFHTCEFSNFFTTIKYYTLNILCCVITHVLTYLLTYLEAIVCPRRCQDAVCINYSMALHAHIVTYLYIYFFVIYLPTYLFTF